jgi:hypothetical protein
MNPSIRSRVLGALGVSLLVAACQASSPTASPAAPPTPPSAAVPSQTAASPGPTPCQGPCPHGVPTAVPTPEPASSSSPSPAASATLPPTGAWTPAGSLPADWYGGPVVRLADGGALAIAGDGSAVARWDPRSATWTKGPGLNAPRSDFAAVALRDGRVLVVGGVNDRQQAYSSAYVYDPAVPGGRWSKIGLMGTARSAPAAAVLADGRVLVAGGAYVDRPAVVEDRAPSAVAAAYHPGMPMSVGGRRSDDVSPSHTVPALATAEILDPVTGTFSPTGSMRYARAGAQAVTLADGRVLVVAPGGELWVGGDTGASIDPRATGTTEAYDPATGRFTLVGSLPEIDRSAIAAAGVEVPKTDPWMTSTGTLVPLADGGALLVGHDVSWKHEADVVRTFRFDGGTGAWHQVGPAYAGVNDWQAGVWRSTPGVDLAGAYAAPLLDGRVLVAGGLESDTHGGLTEARTARTYDAATGTWSDLAPMPTGRQGGRTTTLSDGSVLLVGGDYSDSGGETAVRYVPSS